MTDKERIQWLFIEFLKMETKFEAAAAELAALKAPRYLVAEEMMSRVIEETKKRHTGRKAHGRNKRD